MKYPSAFQLREVKNYPHDSKPCSHSGEESQEPMEGGYGKVGRARWRKPGPNGAVVEVAIKTLKVSQQPFFVSSSGFESVFV